jgi:hypothetical protein
MNGVNGTNDCIAYIHKVASIGANYSPGRLIISASAGAYGNTNYYFEDALGSWYPLFPYGFEALQGVTSNDVPQSAIDYDPFPSNVPITQGTNVAGYFTWGANGVWYFGETNSSGRNYFNNYYTNVFFHGNSGWWIIETGESFNGKRDGGGVQGDFIQWFSSNSFGGTNYSNTPVGAVTHVEEPGGGACENSQLYFGLWAAGKNFAICAWKSRQTGYFQAVGDPLVTR